MAIFLRVLLSSTTLAALSACTTPKPPTFSHEEFGSTETYSRSFPATDARTCEAARRALLSQGYIIDAAKADLVNGRKSFQPAADTHVEIEFHIVCAPESPNPKLPSAKSTLAFVNAVQDRYAIKKGSNSASVGVGVIGSVSLPFAAGDDSLVKVASETIADAKFYERFFGLVERYIAVDRGTADEPPPAPVLVPVPSAAASAAGAPPPAPVTPAAPAAPLTPPPAAPASAASDASS